MYSKLSREVLKQIFTLPEITKKDLIQLRLTCKHWSSVALKHIYKDIDLKDKNLYRRGRGRSAIRKRLALLIRTLVLLNRKNGELIKTIHFGSLLCDTSSEVLNVAVLVQLCPNITKVTVDNISSNFLEILMSLHRQGNLQHLEAMNAMDFSDERDKNDLFTKYHSAILEFKDTFKSINVVDGISKTATTECLISPASLRLFSCAKRLQFLEFSRAHLYQLRDYMSNCPSTVESLDITMLGAAIPPSPTLENGRLDDLPEGHVQNLAVYLKVPLTSDELVLIMRWFPSLKSFSLNLNADSEEDLSYQFDMQVVVQFLNYLSLIPEANYVMCCDVNRGLASLPLLANSVNVSSLSLITSVMFDTELDFYWNKSPAKTLSDGYTSTKSKAFDFTITVVSNQAQVAFISALESFKGTVIENVKIGVKERDDNDGDEEDDHDGNGDRFQQVKLTHQSIDHLMDIHMQRLTLHGVEFPSHAPRLRNRRVKHLQYLCLTKCNISESAFPWLSCQLERINCFEISYDATAFSNEDRKIRITLPYTVLDTISFTVHGVISYIVKVWANHNCVTLKATRSEDTKAITLEELEEVDELSDIYEITIYCQALTKVRCENSVYEMPSDHAVLGGPDQLCKSEFVYQKLKDMKA